MSHTVVVLTRAERAIGAAAIAVAFAGSLATSPGSAAVAPPVVRPVVAVAHPSEAPSPAPTPRRRTSKPAAPVRTHAQSGPFASAPPLTGCPAPVRPPGGGPRPLGPPAVADIELPPPVAVRGKARNLDAVRGKGLWVTPFAKTDVDASALVARARRAGVRSLWIRTGGTRQGYYGDRFLPHLVPVAHAAGIAVVAWDFPMLSDPVADSRRAGQALAAGIDAFSPDVETAAEGTHLTSRRLVLYLSLVRRYAGVRPVVATVPRPSSLRASFPYTSFVPYADVFAPMIYWSCHEPGQLVQQSLLRLGRLLPVAPVGQGYDMGPEGGRAGTPSRAETLRFLDTARRSGGVGASLWSVEYAGKAQLQALADYHWPIGL